MQCEEEQAFDLLKHLMFRRRMRTNYLPDMQNFQLQLYQLSRLIRDRMPELYRWLDSNDVSPTLYAAPWILTIFSSQFPLGFVTRVFGKCFSNWNSIYRLFCVAFHWSNMFITFVYRFTLFGIIGCRIPCRGKIIGDSPTRAPAARQFRRYHELHENYRTRHWHRHHG